MANFKVGQRVRVIEPISRYHGMTGRIWDIGTGVWGENALRAGVRDSDVHYRVEIDGVGRDHHDGISWIAFAHWQIAPLTDPKADEFIEKIKQLGPLQLPIKERA